MSFTLLPELVINHLSALSRAAGARCHAVNLHTLLSSKGKVVQDNIKLFEWDSNRLVLNQECLSFELSMRTGNKTCTMITIKKSTLTSYCIREKYHFFP